MQKTGFVLSGFNHDTGNHPEHADRLRVIEAVYALPELKPYLIFIPAREAEIDELCEIHDRQYIYQVRESVEAGIPALDPDTVISARSYEEARFAAGGILSAVDAVVEGRIRNAFCAVRPPGHHAERDRAMGFCLFNNIAVAARYAQQKHALEKIFIVDWDVHHGNGTQHVFYADPTVFYFSIHQYPHYPGTGRREEQGEGMGVGYTRNFPLPEGSGDREYRQVFQEALVPAVRAYAPDLILVSAGFDGHVNDPLAGMCLTERGFGFMTDTLVQFADELCEGRLISVLEGGYNLSALQGSVKVHLLSLTKQN